MPEVLPSGEFVVTNTEPDGVFVRRMIVRDHHIRPTGFSRILRNIVEAADISTMEAQRQLDPEIESEINKAEAICEDEDEIEFEKAELARRLAKNGQLEVTYIFPGDEAREILKRARAIAVFGELWEDEVKLAEASSEVGKEEKLKKAREELELAQQAERLVGFLATHYRDKT